MVMHPRNMAPYSFYQIGVDKEIHVGDWVSTQRFADVKIAKVYKNPQDALKDGYTINARYAFTGYDGYDIVGKKVMGKEYPTIEFVAVETPTRLKVAAN